MRNSSFVHGQTLPAFPQKKFWRASIHAYPLRQMAILPYDIQNNNLILLQRVGEVHIEEFDYVQFSLHGGSSSS